MRWAQKFAAGKIRLLKRASAIFLVLSLFFPMHSCTRYEENAGSSVPQKSEEIAQTQYIYAWTIEDAKNPSSYLALLALIWPAIAMCLTPFAPRRHPWHIGLSLLEGALLGWTAYVLYFLGWEFGQPEAGAYIATSGLALYLMAWCVETVRKIRSGIGIIRNGNIVRT